MANKKGFTLIEIMVAIAIVGILAGAVLVSMSSYRAKARSSKLDGSLSSAVVSMQSCWTFGGEVLAPSSDANICSLNSSYGKWPNISSDSYSYSENSKESCVPATPPARGSDPVTYCINSDTYFLSASNDTDQKKICCNSTMNGCKIIDYSSVCDSGVN
jgi:prepilin-type N-terminal cleavage/methylation domain-containing protein